ncbi:hypothetical protein BDF14DRAFT_1831607 [Spinellus fusiger]|nr:hypothetical protein BDF14DRAFT_1831607 [Spinellus fusiger]
MTSLFLVLPLFSSVFVSNRHTMADNPHTNTFLKNLAQKKYAWMQTPTATFTQPRTDPAKAEQPKKEDTRPAKKPRPKSMTLPVTAVSPTPLTLTCVAVDTEPTTSPPPSSLSASPPQFPPSSLTALSSSSAPTVPTVPTAIDITTTPTTTPPPLHASLLKKRPVSPMTTLPTPSTDYIQPHPTTHNNTERTKKIQLPRFKYTTFPVRGFNILPTRNITSTFVKSDVTYFPGNKAGAEAIMPNPEEEWQDIIVIHPGSRNLRIGLASEAFPKTVPHVIARRIRSTHAQTRKKINVTLEGKEEAVEELKNELKWRMKSAKRRAVPNAESQVVGFNAQAYQEMIPDHNDPYKVEWTEPTPDSEYFVGEKALNLPMEDNSDYRLFYPWKHGALNNQDHVSLQAVMSDLQTIWTEMIRTELDIEEKDFEDYNAVLVIPDIYPRTYTCELVTFMLRFMKFRGVLVQQESTCATFGAGVSSACVVDIGAQKTSIACIEDGVYLVESRTLISMGGDDITKTFTSLLLANRFPYADIDLERAHDWRLAEELKTKWCTMNEADISIQVYDFFVRVPHAPTKKYQCKVYDEVFLAPLCLFYPSIVNVEEKIAGKVAWVSANVVDDITEEGNPQVPLVTLSSSVQRSKVSTALPKSNATATATETPAAPSSSTPQKSQEHIVYPLDIAIAQSIQIASGPSEERLKRFFTNIILVGGGGMVGNFNRVLEDRLLSTRIAQLNSIEHVEVLPAPRELDSRLLVWKGASVLSKLDIAKELWIGREEWDQVGARCLKDRTLFS